MRDEYAEVLKVFSDHGGLPINDDDLAASTVKNLVLDMGYDPIWASKILVSALNKVNETFDREPVKVVSESVAN
ncbi:hypothetical protein [Roseobacter weihaiensis]|uniref:hypothetical protein n=1 Tax=Roseobacter weihaiensis TaxID=2763262 RepID=UPI001D0B00E2|nr:hypothetical protein [Roseobacter sp. H9]